MRNAEVDDFELPAALSIEELLEDVRIRLVVPGQESERGRFAEGDDADDARLLLVGELLPPEATAVERHRERRPCLRVLVESDFVGAVLCVATAFVVRPPCRGLYFAAGGSQAVHE